MAKFNTSAIPNFENLSADELRNALAGLEVPSNDEMNQLKNELQKKSNAFDKTSSELAEAKRAMRATQTAEEQAKADRDAADKELRERYEALLKENAIAKDAARFASLGMDSDMATSIATAMADGDKDAFFSHLTTFKANTEKVIRSDVVKNTPKPDTAGVGTNKMSKEDIMAIKDTVERQQAIQNNIELFS